MQRWAEKTSVPVKVLVGALGISRGKFYDWKKRFGKANEHNGSVPRDHWIDGDEKAAIIRFHQEHPLEGYRRLAFMGLDADVFAVSPSTVYRVLRAAGVLDRRSTSPSKKGTGFKQPTRPHQHWHTDISYLNIAGTFYYLCCVLDGYSRALIHWEVREQMTEADVEIILERARELVPGVTPRLITDNGPQFIARDFKTYIRLAGMTHVRTSPYYPQSNGKLEALNKTIKKTTIRPRRPQSVEEARELMTSFSEHYNEKRLHSSLGYVTPADKLAGREKAIWASRNAKLKAARERRREQRCAARQDNTAAA